RCDGVWTLQRVEALVGRVCFAVDESESLKQRAQRVARDAQQLRGLHLVGAAEGEGVADGQLFQALMKIRSLFAEQALQLRRDQVDRALGRLARCAGEAKVACQDLAIGRHEQRAVNDILQL